MAKMTNIFTLTSLLSSLISLTSSKLQMRLKDVDMRLKLVESRVNTLETRLTMETTQRMDSTMEVMEMMSDLNTTVMDMTDICTQDTSGVIDNALHSDSSKGQQPRNAFMDRNTMKGTILSAFSDEKRWIRERMREVKEQLDDFENDIEDTKDAQVKILVEDTTKQMIETKLSDYKTEMVKLFHRQGKENSDSLDDLRDEVDNNFEKHNDMISECSEMTKKINNQLNIMTLGFEQQIDALKGTINSRFQRLYECPDHWLRYDLFCYHFFNVPVEYHKARALCGDLGSHVVDLKDKRELEFVMSLVRGSNFWIGLTDSDREGTWKWDRTGAVTSFTNWRPGQPDNRKGSNQDCAIAGWTHPRDQWNDQGCSFKHAFVCKKSL